MIYRTKDLLEKGETQYSIRNKLLNGELFLIERGVYSDVKTPLIDEKYVSMKYPLTTVTGLSAFFIYGLTDHIPDEVHVSSPQHRVESLF